MQVVGKMTDAEATVVLETRDGVVGDIRRLEGAPPTEAVGGTDLGVCPALLDIQVNGFAGHDLGGEDTTIDDVAAVTKALHAAGVGLYCPTICTQSAKVMSASVSTVARACEEDEEIANSTVCIHLEGPYIADEDGPRGAHSPRHTRDPDWDEFCRFQDAAGGRIGIVTLAPERNGAIEFIEKLADEGVVVALGHTGADADQIRDAVKAGARLSTHLGNGAHAMLSRHPNYIWEQLASDELWASIIPDGHHLPPSVVKCIIRAKGLNRTILISDAVRDAGLEPGDYESGGRKVEVTPDGRVQLKGTPYLAGSALKLHTGVGNAVRFGDVSLADAVGMATLNPARLLGIDDRYGTVEPGKEADLLLFRWDKATATLEVCQTIVRGQTVYSAQAGDPPRSTRGRRP